MRGASLIVTGIVMVHLFAAAGLGQQSGKSAPAKNAGAPAKAPAKAPPAKRPAGPAKGMTRLYLSMQERYSFLTRVPSRSRLANCTAPQDWRRRLLGDITGGDFKISLKAYRHDPGYRPAKTEEGPVRILLSLLLRSPKPRPMPASYIEKLNGWVRENIRSGAPPAPDPNNEAQWREWAMRNSKGAGFPPSPGDLDQAERREGRPTRYETLLASTTIDILAGERVYTASLSVPDPESSLNDELILQIAKAEGTACVSADPDGFSFLDLPEIALEENRADFLNRAGADDGESAPAAVLEPATGTVRLHLAVNESYSKILTSVPAADRFADCTGGSTIWKRKLEGDLQGNDYAVHLMAYTHGYDAPPGKIRVSLIHRSQLFENVRTTTTFSAEEPQRWARSYAKEGAPAPPSPSDRTKWIEWAVRHGRPGAPAIPVLADPRSYDPGGARTGPPPSPPLGMGETLLASTTLEVDALPRPRAAALKGADVEASPGDWLHLMVENLEGTACVGTDPAGRAFVDIPSTPLSETPEDSINRTYVITGTLVNRAGTPLAKKTLIFSSQPGITNFGPPGPDGRMYMINPRVETDARGVFRLRVPARFFDRAGETVRGYLQVGEPTGRGYNMVGEPFKIESPSRSSEPINLGKLVQKAP